MIPKMEVESTKTNIISHLENEGSENHIKQILDKQDTFDSFLDIKLETSSSPIFTASVIKTTNKTLKYRCSLCEKKFKTEEKAQKHVCSHVTVHRADFDDDLKCLECYNYFENKDSFQLHIESHKKRRGRPKKDTSIEDEVKRFICDKCGKSFKKKQQLSNHSLVHQDIKLYQCDQCEKCFKLKQQLLNHLKVHQDIRPFPCEICGKPFKFKQQLENHSKTHSNIRPFKCVLCDKAFKFKQQLQIHHRVHDDLRPFVCEFCNKSFKLKQQLQFHEKVHSDDRPFSCESCNKSFKFKQQLKTHYKVHTTAFMKNHLIKPNISLSTEDKGEIHSSQELSSKS